MLSSQIHIRLGVEGGTAGNHLVNHAGGRVQVATGIDLLAADLLGGHVACATHHHVRLGQRLAGLLNRARNAEVHDLNLARLTFRDILAGAVQHHDVRRLNIAVNDAHRVAVLERAQQLLGVAQRIAHRQVTATRQDGAQGVTLHVLHHDIGDERRLARGLIHAVALGRIERTGVIHRNNRRIIQRRDGLRLPLETGTEGLILGLLRTQNLKSHLAAEAGVLGSVNGRHRTGTDYLEYLVTVINRVGNRQVHKFSWINKTKTKSKRRG